MRNDGSHTPENCRPIGDILTRVGDKWAMMVLGVLGDRRMRFNELHRAIDGISQRMLTVTVRNLERDGLLVRTVYPTIPPRVEYEVSELGRSLKQALTPIGEWVSTNRDDIEASRRRFDSKAGLEESDPPHLPNGK